MERLSIICQKVIQYYIIADFNFTLHEHLNNCRNELGV